MDDASNRLPLLTEFLQQFHELLHIPLTHEHNLCPRGVVSVPGSRGSFQQLNICRTTNRSDDILNAFLVQASGTEDHRRVYRHVEHRGFNADFRRPGVQHDIHLAFQIVHDMLRTGGTWPSREIGARTDDSTFEFFDQRQGNRMVRHADTNGIEAGRDNIRNEECALYDKGQRTWPEILRP